MIHRLGEIAQRFGCTLYGDPDYPIEGVHTLEDAGPGQISFLANRKYRHLLDQTRAGAVVLHPQQKPHRPGNWLTHDNPYATFARIAALFEQAHPLPVGIHPTAVVDPSASIHPEAAIGPYAVIGPEVHIGPGCVIHAHCVIQHHCRLEAQCTLHPHVTLYPRCRLGRSVVIHASTVIGSDGFGYAPDQGCWVKIPQLGGVDIGDDCEIGAGTTIDRGALDDTRIGEGSKLDNQIQIAHNVQVGRHTVMAGCSAISGSSSVGDHCQIGGGAGLAGHLRVNDHVTITGMTLVSHDIREAGVYSSGVTQQEARQWRRNLARLHHLDELARKLRRLEQRLAELEGDPARPRKKD